MKRLLYFTLAIGCLLCTADKSFAGNYSLSEFLPIQNAIAGASLVVNDPQYQEEILYTAGQHYDVSRVLKVRLAYGRQSQSDRLVGGSMPQWKVRINYTVHDLVTGTNIPDNHLTIEGGDNNPVYESVNSHPVTSGVISVTVDSREYVTGTPPGDIQLEAIEEVTKYTLFTPTTSYNIYYNPQADAHGQLSWEFMDGAEAYDLEWVHIDAKDAYSDLSQVPDPFDVNEPVRIRTTDNHYLLDMTYPEGTVYFRVRGIGRFLTSQGATNDDRGIIYGDWQRAYGGNWVSVSIGSDFESNKTWELVKSYAEGGKNKKVITYYDETSRSRQSVTNLSTNGTVAIAEKKYDYEGRPVVSFLPFPLTGTNLGYKSGLELNSQNQVFSKVDFDAGTNMPRQVQATAGAGQYYSPNMPTIANAINQAYTPDAGGYPYTQVVYDRDNRNRPVRQSGVGADHTLYGYHDTKYSYETAKDNELYRLFGSNVGIVKHYKKNYVQDANGQLSASYLDQEGRTIATALAGAAPANVNNLAPSPDYVTADLCSNSLYDENAGTISSITEQTNTVADNQYVFHYSIDRDLMDSKPCLTCKYHVEITIKDPQGRDVITPTSPSLDQSTISSVSPSTALVGNAITQDYSVSIQRGIAVIVTGPGGGPVTIYQPLGCPSGFPSSTGSDISFTATFHQVGQYTISKVLKLIEPSESEVRAIVAADPANHNLLDTTEILKELLDSTHFSNCNVTCEDQCRNSSDPDCIAKCKQDAISQAKDSVIGNECEGYLSMMKQQVSPGGIYYQLWQAQNSTTTTPGCSSPISPANVLGLADNSNTIKVVNANNDTLKYGDGTAMMPTSSANTASSSQMADMLDPTKFQSSWADALVVFHPEYCHYILCKQLTNSNDYDVRMGLAKTQTQATSSSTLYSCDPASFTDPVHSLSGFGSISRSAFTGAPSQTFDQAIADYFNEGAGGGSSLGSLWVALGPPTGNFINVDNTTGAVTGGTQASTWPLKLQQGLYANMGNADNDVIDQRHWALFRGYYLQIKLRYIDSYAATVCTSYCQSSTGYIPDTADKKPYSYTIFPQHHYGDDQVNDLNNLASGQTFIDRSAELMNASVLSACQNHCTEAAKTWMDQLVPDDALVTASGGSLGDPLISIEPCMSPFLEIMLDPHVPGTYDTYRTVHTTIYQTVLSEMTAYCNTQCQTFVDMNTIGNINYNPKKFQQILQETGGIYVPIIDNGAIHGLSTPQLSATLNSLLDNEIISDSCVRPNRNCQDRVNYWMSQIEKRCDGLTTLDVSGINYQLTRFCSHISNIFNDNLQLSGIFLQDQSKIPGGPIAMIEDILNTHNCSMLNNSIGEGFNNSCVVSPCFINRFIQNYNITAYVEREGSSGCNCVRLTQLGVDSMNSCLDRLPSIINSETQQQTGGGSTQRLNVYIPPGGGDNPPSTNCIMFVFFDTLGNIVSPTSITWLTDPINTFNPIPALPAAFSQYEFTGIAASATITGQSGTQRVFLFKPQGNTACDVNFVKCDFSIDDWKRDCISFLEDKAEYEMHEIYQHSIDSLTASYFDEYKRRCFTNRPAEAMTMRYLLNEYHYTLYYYDQAGNLVQTVPPEGVHPCSEAAAIRISKGTHTNSDQPHHTLLTNYQYNSINQVISQNTPDGGTTNFWYNSKGQLRLSQNAKQAISTDKRFSFTSYDGQGRIVLVGEVKGDPATVTTQQLDDQQYPILQVFYGTIPLTEITSTTYDAGSSLCGIQENLRGRVAEVTTGYLGTGSDVTFHYNTTGYSYDPHGNVKRLYQAPNDLGCTVIDYDYDLISGKVNRVDISNPDLGNLEFHHKYEYDADNRITNVYTSHDGVIWDEDADYFYYPHGPLARTEIGQDKVQGQDYYYTIHGWLKGVNKPGTYANDDNVYNSTRASYDPGLDGYFAQHDQGPPLQVNSYVAQDQLAYQLSYYEGDYTAVNTTANPTANSNANSLSTMASIGGPVLPVPLQSTPPFNKKGLYNGNIVAMVNDIAFMTTLPSDRVVGTSYTYDQLNRINNSYYNSYDHGTWTAGGNKYATSYDYDANGNIKHLNRFSESGAQFDNLTYNYSVDGNGYLANNKLNSVADGMDVPAITADIKNQTNASNYKYDPIGNLIEDASENNMKVVWNVYGKIKSITQGADAVWPKKFILFSYDAMGNRTGKNVGTIDANGDATWTHNIAYIHDASGNIMATYDYKPVLTGNPPNELELASVSIDYPIYGSSRLGVYTQVVSNPFMQQNADDPALLGTYRRLMTKRNYELTDHLGNVMAVISDLKKGIPTAGNTDLKYYTADVISAQDYFPFGMNMPARQYGSQYRFGFNGQEKDDEIAGTGNITTALFWEYESRLGRRWNLDPIVKPWESGYATFSNNSIFYSDPYGDDVTDPNGKNVVAPDAIGQSPDRRTLYNSPNTNGNWDQATWNDKDGAYQFHYTTQKDAAPSEPTKRAEPVNCSPPIHNASCHPDNTYLEIEGWKVLQEKRAIYAKLDFAHGQFAPIQSKTWDAIFGHRLTSDGKELTPEGQINPYPTTYLTVADNPLLSMTDGIGELSLLEDARLLNLTTSSRSLAASRAYTIYDAYGQLFKFGVTDAKFERMYQSLKLGGPSATAKFTGIMTKTEAHLVEKYLRSLHYNSTGIRRLPGMKVPHPIDFDTGKKIKF